MHTATPTAVVKELKTEQLGAKKIDLRNNSNDYSNECIHNI